MCIETLKHRFHPRGSVHLRRRSVSAPRERHSARQMEALIHTLRGMEVHEGPVTARGSKMFRKSSESVSKVFDQFLIAIRDGHYDLVKIVKAKMIERPPHRSDPSTDPYDEARPIIVHCTGRTKSLRGNCMGHRGRSRSRKGSRFSSPRWLELSSRSRGLKGVLGTHTHEDDA